MNFINLGQMLLKWLSGIWESTVVDLNLSAIRIYFPHYTVIPHTMQGTHIMAPTTLRASYSISALTLQRFNAVVPLGERSRVIEAYMRQALVAREREFEAVAAAFTNDPANAVALEDEKLWDVTIGDGLENTPV